MIDENTEIVIGYTHVVVISEIQKIDPEHRSISEILFDALTELHERLAT